MTGNVYIILVGSPGTGKSMLMKDIKTFLEAEMGLPTKPYYSRFLTHEELNKAKVSEHILCLDSKDVLELYQPQ